MTAAERQALRRLIDARRRAQVDPHECLYCRAPLINPGPRQQYCSETHRKAAQAQRLRARVAA